MEDEYDYTEEQSDLLCMRVAALCQLADTINESENKQVHRRLLSAMDLVLATLTPKPKTGGILVDITGRR